MLSPGDTAPPFELPDQNNDPVSLDDYDGKHVVLYFYPKAKTGGCTREARAFRDQIDAFEDRNVAVLGVSTDPVDLITEFADEEALPFRLLADADGTVTAAYDTRRDSGTAERTTYLIGPDGTIEATYASVSPERHPQQLLDDLDQLATS